MVVLVLLLLLLATAGTSKVIALTTTTDTATIIYISWRFSVESRNRAGRRGVAIVVASVN